MAKKSKKNKKAYFTIVIILLVLVVIAGFFLLNTKGEEEQVELGGGEYDDFIKCVTASGVKMYGSVTCSICNKQKSLFGKSFDFMEEIECNPYEKGNQAEHCLEVNIEHTPTWIRYDDQGNEADRAEGYQSIETLSEFSGCEA